VLTKAALRDNIYFDLLSDNSDKRTLRKVVTCGATGEPLGVFVDRLQLDMRWANAMRAAEWTGYRFGDHQARLWTSAPHLDAMDTAKEGADAVLARRTRLAVIPVDDAVVHRVADQVRRHRPALLDGDAEAFTLLACLLEAAGQTALPGRAIVTAGQTLSTESRALIECRFGGRVFDRWSAGEFGPIAQQCEASAGYHVNAESFLVEVLRDGRPAAEGEDGEVVVTDLGNRCVPLLRYALGDRAVVTHRACPCGRGLPLLERVCGRPQGVVQGGAGRWVPATFFARLFEGYEYAVRRYQVIQDSPGRLDLRIVRRSRFTAETERAIRTTLARVLGDGMTVGIEFLDPMALTGDAMTPTCVGRVVPEGFPLPGAPVASDAGVGLVG
jgi:phenylacetate-CoA ligase